MPLRRARRKREGLMATISASSAKAVARSLVQPQPPGAFGSPAPPSVTQPVKSARWQPPSQKSAVHASPSSQMPQPGEQVLAPAALPLSGGQSVHAVAPLPVAKVPAAQGAQRSAKPEYVPAAQAVQLAEPTLATEPAGQASQRSWAGLTAVPAGQGRQVAAPRGLHHPAAQTSQRARPGPAEVPASHGTQPAMPGSAAEVPAGQGVQLASPTLLMVPGWHGVHSVLPGFGAMLPASQRAQERLSADPDQVPAGQVLQLPAST
jgi:hypothetical protein